MGSPKPSELYLSATPPMPPQQNRNTQTALTIETWERPPFSPPEVVRSMLSSIACGGATALAWQSITRCNPSGAVRAAFWLSPLLTLIQSLYACWVNPRFEYATKVLSISMAPSPPSTGFVFLSVVSGTVYATFLVAGIGGATAIGTSIDTRVHPGNPTELSLDNACDQEHTACHHGTHCVPEIHGTRMSFCFSCANCYSGVASTLVMYGNRWGFVHVGVCNKGFVQASGETWEMFKRAGLEPVINYDLTGSFCFLSGVAVGAICTLVAGSWALVIHKSYATEVSIYAFLIGYLICRIAMAWPQACVSAYYVAYSEDPQSVRFDSTTIRDCIDRIQRYRA
ncbi:hypothetical protein CK203_036698 [Vitis vinifera]|uniref:Choline transporter-like protein n=1 Tax=Vitis vinifera TaxID=29760 RepID=A0A438I102_VITVI|nr:hypothetical protein CK203_036698 [Vitis vinifera]